MVDEPSREDLALVALHGSGSIERALATVQLAQRSDAEEALVDLLNDLTADSPESIDE